MTTTTSYGTWCTQADRNNTGIGGTVTDYCNGGDSDWWERLVSTGAYDAVVGDYRDAINAALPSGVSLVGDEFIGPYYAEDHTWEGDLDIGEIIAEIDLQAIVERHDPDNTEA